MILTNSGVLKLMQRIKSFITSQLNTKAPSVHTHTLSEIDDLSSLQMGGGGYSKSEVDTLLSNKSDTSHTHTVSNITDFPTIPSKTSDLTNDSGFLTSHQDLSGYIPKSGGAVMTGSRISRVVNTNELCIDGGTSFRDGATLTLFGKNTSNSGNEGAFWLTAHNASEYTLRGKPDGSLIWGTKNLAMQEDTIPRSGGGVITGNSIGRDTNTGNLDICGGTSYENGAFIALRGKDSSISEQKGVAIISANNGTSSCSLNCYPNGTLSWGSKHVAMQEDVIPRDGGVVLTGKQFARTVDNDSLLLESATSSSKGAFIELFGSSRSDSFLGRINIVACSSDGEGKYLIIYPNGSLEWTGQPIQYVSDQRLKQQISKIDNNLLDAWEDVDLVQFKYNDAVDSKGDNARLHTGYVVQQIEKACNEHGVDISDYGLYCHEEYPEETEEVEVEQQDGTKTKEKKVIRESSEHYSLRYTEALIVECAYLRREINRLKEQMKK